MRLFNFKTSYGGVEPVDEFITRYQENPKLVKVIEKLEEGFDDAIQYLNEDEKYHPYIHSTNSLERLNQEDRRR